MFECRSSIMNNTAIPKKQSFALLMLMLVCYEILRTAWIADDAALSLRSVLNVIHGFGPTFNLDERVQVYTHPLWFFLLVLVTFITGNVFLSAFLLPISLSLAVFWVLIGLVSVSLPGQVLAALLLLFSKAYVDFSTSGLENPLTHLLLLLSVLICANTEGLRLRPRFMLAQLATLGSLLYLTRPDAVLPFLPLAYFALSATKVSWLGTLRIVLGAGIPIFVWTLWSLYYYGSPFPNTYYAKLGAGIPLTELVPQGINYIADAWSRDRISIVAILIALPLGLWRSSLERYLAAAILLHLLYVVSIGGDFMAGRFLSIPILFAACIFARQSSRILTMGICVPLLFLAVRNWPLTLGSGDDVENYDISEAGIADERAYYYQRYGLMAKKGVPFLPPRWQLGERKVSVLCGQLGFASIRSGPSTHWIDDCALADPFLSRLPAVPNPQWRIGHFYRALPEGYVESVKSGENQIQDAQKRALYESVRIRTRGDLHSWERLREILRSLI